MMALDGAATPKWVLRCCLGRLVAIDRLPGRGEEAGFGLQARRSRRTADEIGRRPWRTS
jgi:hypothetical protein